MPDESLRPMTCWPLLCALLLGCPVLAAPPALPEPRANNPVARLEADGGGLWFTGLGIGPGRTWRDVQAGGWIWRAGDAAWRAVPPLPAFEGRAGRLGSHAVAIGGAIHVIGGYTVAEDHAERSTPGIYRLRLAGDPEWTIATNMPVPVDDAVALVHADRFLYLVSGWSDTGNVNLVQVWDSREDAWRQAEPWPGAPVFGHAGGLVGNRMVICGGARIEYPADGPRKFIESEECWLGTIRDDDLRRLDWKPLPAMPGGPRYRAAAAGAVVDGRARIVFAGGADRPYNYDGQGYDGMPTAPLPGIVSLDIDALRWQCHTPLPRPTMDHRGLVFDSGRLVIVGGMDQQRRVLDTVQAVTLSPARSCP